MLNGWILPTGQVSLERVCPQLANRLLSKPRQSQRLLYKHRCHSLTDYRSAELEKPHPTSPTGSNFFVTFPFILFRFSAKFSYFRQIFISKMSALKKKKNPTLFLSWLYSRAIYYQKVRNGYFSLLVKLHRKGSACSLRSRLVTPFIGHICLIEPKGSIGHVFY